MQMIEDRRMCEESGAGTERERHTRFYCSKVTDGAAAAASTPPSPPPPFAFQNQILFTLCPAVYRVFMLSQHLISACRK